MSASQDVSRSPSTELTRLEHLLNNKVAAGETPTSAELIDYGKVTYQLKIMFYRSRRDRARQLGTSLSTPLAFRNVGFSQRQSEAATLMAKIEHHAYQNHEPSDELLYAHGKGVWFVKYWVAQEKHWADQERQAQEKRQQASIQVKHFKEALGGQRE